MKRTMLGMAVLALALGAPVGVAAGRGESVDPALMQPPLNATFGPWECWRTGTGITCEGHRTLTAVGAETVPRLRRPAGLHERGRHANAAPLRRRERPRPEDRSCTWTSEGVLGLEPDLSGPNLTGRGIFQETYYYLVPGDLSTRTDRYTGLDVRFTGPGVGLVVHDVGVKTFDIDDNVLFMPRVRIPSWRTSRAAFAGVCPALEAIGA